MRRDLLVHVDGTDAGRRRLQFAIDLALRTGARLSGLHVMPPADVPPLYKPSQLDEAVANMSLKLTANARAAKEAFREEVAQRLTDTRWLELTSQISFFAQSLGRVDVRGAAAFGAAAPRGGSITTPKRG
jgi:nucleotide-binding universal stress UspA family protein